MRCSTQTSKTRSQYDLTTITLFMFFLCFNILLSQETISHTYTTSRDQTAYMKQINNFPDKKMGVKFKSLSHVKTLKGSVELEMRATNSKMSNYICELLGSELKVIPILDDDNSGLVHLKPMVEAIPANMLLFKTTLNQSFINNASLSPNAIHRGTGSSGVTYYKTRSLNSCINVPNLGLYVEGVSNTPVFFVNNFYTWNIALHHFGENLFKLYDHFVPVTVTLTFTGDYTLDDISEIIFPGLTLLPKDFDTELFFNNNEYYWSKSEDAGDPSEISMILENNELEIRGNATTPLSDDTGVEEVTMEVWGKFLTYNNSDTCPAIDKDFKYNLWIQNHLVTEAFIIQPKENWADYVFNDTYKLLNLKDLKTYIKKHKHLPNIPTIKDLENNGGYTQHDLNVKLLEKIEQLTLYKIQQAKKISELETNINQARQAIVAYKTPH